MALVFSKCCFDQLAGKKQKKAIQCCFDQLAGKKKQLNLPEDICLKHHVDFGSHLETEPYPQCKQ